jgi:AraC family transcriptional regulator of adaptative response/methylated-DNA-[protein]-cysteine methyltransferase
LLPRADKAAQGLLQASCAALQAGDDLHLYVRGSDFRLAVWRGLLTIPPGECLSYGELAQQLGRPEAARAVGSAAAANAIAGFIPCHRLVPAGGGVGAYRWGSALKATILAAERASGGSCVNTLL